MSRHNYSQYSNKKNDNKIDITPDVTVEKENEVNTAVTDEVDTTIKSTVENTSITDTDVTVTTIENKSTVEDKSGAVVTGVVANCKKLNVRSKPDINGDVVAMLNVDDIISIDVDKSTNEWFKICTVNGVKGYCMRKFVSANI
jgi:hypothetical protein